MTEKELRKHPGLNPAYFATMAKRHEAQAHNRAAVLGFMHKVPVPKQPNRYLPHYGAKQAAKARACAVFDAVIE